MKIGYHQICLSYTHCTGCTHFYKSKRSTHLSISSVLIKYSLVHFVLIHDYSKQDCKLNFDFILTSFRSKFLHKNINRNNFLLCREGDIYDDVDYAGGELSLHLYVL